MAFPPRRRVKMCALRGFPFSDCSSYVQKSKTPWRAGFKPVESDVQAGGVSGGYLDSRMASQPSSWSFLKLGNSPRSINGWIMRNVRPSTPKITVRICVFLSLSAIGHNGRPQGPLRATLWNSVLLCFEQFFEFTSGQSILVACRYSMLLCCFLFNEQLI